MKFLLLIFYLLFATTGIAQAPLPFQIEKEEGSFSINKKTQIYFDTKSFEKNADYFINYLIDKYNLELNKNFSSGNGKQNAVVLKLNNEIEGTESYKLKVTARQIIVSANNEQGIFYGIQTLLQLLSFENKQELVIDGVNIFDKPFFSYRGVMLDVSRHFFNTDYIKKFIDYLAFHKINKFHWHLTDDQGWRIEIKKYPLLTQTGSCRAQTLIGRFGSNIYDGTKYCGYYSQKEIKEIIKYAADRYITIIPEIDLPGHSTAMLASYPFLGCTKGPYKVSETWGVHKEVLCAGNDSTYNFLEDVFSELIELFPSDTIHIGGDECLKERWKECPVCQKRIKTENLKNEIELQSYFIKRLSKFLSEKGKRIIGWDEILDGGGPANSIIMNWRGEKIGLKSAESGHDVILTPEKPFYLNFRQSINEDSLTQGGLNTLEMVYNYNPFQTLNKVAGVQANLWTEYISNTRKLEYMLFPRIAAFAEVAWLPKEKRDFNNFAGRLPKILNFYKFNNINYSDAYYDLTPEILHQKGNIYLKLSSVKKGNIYFKNPASNSVFLYNSPIHINISGLWTAYIIDSTGETGNILKKQFHINKATGKNIILKNQPNEMYYQQGASTLVDGIQNNEGMVKSGLFLGFLGKDLEAVIDLEKNMEINKIVLRTFEQTESWIYRPSSVSVFISDDNKNWKEIPNTMAEDGKNISYVAENQIKARYIKILAKPHGIIEKGMPGAGHQSWIFSDEIIIN